MRGRWRALVRVKPYRDVSRSFLTEAEAHKWGKATEAEMAARRLVQPDKVRLRTLIERYIEEHPKMGRSKRHSLQLTARSKLGDEMLAGLTADRLVRHGRQRGVAGMTLTNDLSALSTVLKHAAAIWVVRVENNVPAAKFALRTGGFLDPAQERDRRPTADELSRIKAWFMLRRSKVPMTDIIDFACATAMRAGEIVGIRWADYDAERATVLVRQRKHPTKKRQNDQLVPLLRAAVEIIERQPRDGERIFPYSRVHLSCLFPDACRALGIKDLHLHDLRHEGASRLFELGYSIQEVAMFTGHEDWKQLKRYTQLRPEKLRRLG